jgi:hypothetical protein
MTITEFKLLDKDHQLAYTFEAGVYLMERKSRSFLVILFEVDRFYVETFSLRENGEVLMIRSSDDTDILDFYLEKIDISEVVNY